MTHEVRFKFRQKNYINFLFKKIRPYIVKVTKRIDNTNYVNFPFKRTPYLVYMQFRERVLVFEEREGED